MHLIKPSPKNKSTMNPLWMLMVKYKWTLKMKWRLLQRTMMETAFSTCAFAGTA